jgi:hypothetical protein
MSDLLDELAQLGTPKAPIQCRTCRAMLVEPELGEALMVALGNGATQGDISAVLQRHGYDVSVDSLRKHLKNGHQPL